MIRAYSKSLLQRFLSSQKAIIGTKTEARIKVPLAKTLAYFIDLLFQGHWHCTQSQAGTEIKSDRQDGKYLSCARNILPHLVAQNLQQHFGYYHEITIISQIDKIVLSRINGFSCLENLNLKQLSFEQ